MFQLLILQLEVEQGETGNIVLGMPLCPTGFRTLWQDDSRFETGYLSRFRGAWLDTGDAGMIDGEVTTLFYFHPGFLFPP